ncbi:MAG: S8 family serine peptidase [Planctomycetota bacterium]|nr:S8 family serine peptidase [Planctomycetota bacterium]
MRLGRASSLLAALLAAAGVPAALAGPGGRVDVKFREGSGVRASGGGLVDHGSGSLNGARAVLADLAARGFAWERAAPDLSDAYLDGLRLAASAALGRAAPDQTLHVVLKAPAGEDARAVAEMLRGLSVVHWAEAADEAPPAPAAPDFSGLQGYRGAAPTGIGSTVVSGASGGRGEGVAIVAVDYSWNLSHRDLPPGIGVIGPAPVDPFNNPQHGTAALGELVSLEDGVGTTGMAPGAVVMVSAANTASGYSVAAAINRALAVLEPGDVILVLQQSIGPRYTGSPAGTQVGLLPSEWNLATYDAIVTAVAHGVTVVAAAGNGSQNLDDPLYASFTHKPFLPQNDSGSILVGAGAPPGGAAAARSRLGTSNFGSTLDLQGWGAGVFTTGFGDAYAAEGSNSYYTANFSGTSSAAPMAAAAVALVQSRARAELGGVLSPAQVRSVLRATGSAQPTSDAALRPIGPLPNVEAAVASVLSTSFPPPGAFGVLSPAPGERLTSKPGELRWSVSQNATAYRVVLDDSADLSSPLIERRLAPPLLALSGEMTAPGRTFYWRVEATGPGGVRAWSSGTASFTVAAPACTADVNDDGTVSFPDIVTVLRFWGGRSAEGDANGDGVVDLGDLTAVLQGWGAGCST